MNRTRRILSALGLALALGSTLPACVITARGRLQGGAVVAYDAPPERRVENPQPMAGHVWIAGNWTWQNNRWVWVDGHYERQRAGYQWQDGRWEPRNGSWHWVSGQWIVVGQGTVVTGNGNGAVIVGGHGDHPRDRNQDHRYDPPPPPPPGGGGVVVGGGGGGVIVNNGGGGLSATNGAGTVTVNNGQVVITGPQQPPPPIRVENPGAARRGYVWIEGSWQWANNQYEWVPGHWERAKAGYRWEPVRWQLQGNVYVRVGGSWVIGN